MHRDRAERLIEFAMGSPEVDKHILHIHGRADHPPSMIVSYRDYDRLYRRKGVGKLPFEHGLKILFSGNPVLFLGLGMSEPELNATLEEFIGNHPLSRKAPGLLIWNPLEEEAGVKKNEAFDNGTRVASKRLSKVNVEEKRTAFRLDKLHRLGILTIFGDELEGFSDPPYKNRENQLRESLRSLKRYIHSIRKERTADIDVRRWRNSDRRVTSAFKKGVPAKRRSMKSIVSSWSVDWIDPKLSAGISIPSLEFDNGTMINVISIRSGVSKTAIAKKLSSDWVARRRDSRLSVTINFNMRIDTDSILEMLARTFAQGASVTPAASQMSRERFFSNIDQTAADGRDVLVVLKGLERIFDANGNPLSAEFDDFLRAMVSRKEYHNIRIAVVATDRVRSYFENWENKEEREEKEVSGQKVERSNSVSVKFLEQKPSDNKINYLQSLENEFEEILESIHGPNIAAIGESDYVSRRRRVYQIVLKAETLTRHKIYNPELAFEILSTFAFIGQPVEMEVLWHAPLVRMRLDRIPDSKIKRTHRRHLRDCIRQLEKTGLLREINKKPNKTSYERRYAIHLSLQSELRDRYGIPLSDSILSTAYNMSLFSAQPADAAIPEPALHDKLGHLVDWLIGAEHDEPFDPDARRNTKAEPHVVSALRAALAVMRGIYSTSALLSLENGDRAMREDRDGALTEHAERIERLADAFKRTCEERTKDQESGQTPKGPEVLYRDELVWLHNERGVVKLVQGDLYEARFSLNEAERLNRTYLEFHDRSHNWRRISINQIVLDIERARLQSAEDRMQQIEDALSVEKANHIREEYLDSESMRRIRFDQIATYEDILAMSLVTGYRGLVAHLKGELDLAQRQFERAIVVLQRLDEQRALSLFRRHLASVLADLGDRNASRLMAQQSAAGAESVRQMDIAYAGRLTESCSLDAEDSIERKKHGLILAGAALDYSLQADLHRLNIEAQGRLAWSKFNSGDFDTAMEHVSEGMAISARYGMTLHKISLRTLMGRIFIARGDKRSGFALLKNAARGAARAGYQRAVESAKRAFADHSN